MDIQAHDLYVKWHSLQFAIEMSRVLVSLPQLEMYENNNGIQNGYNYLDC